ncbi:hypothetical protein SAMN05216475_2628 [Pseudomonas synxantha]|uniref:Uncharacterized protein n=1 Tax=Pseudomonas synxantha TaxID=47883 RepID=A0AAX3I9D0_9PSED|nr:hypothetical protein [Pseudomonas synxantha]AZE66747.1 hypothetical protein C4K01_2552 [Pseudomonas synxantha]KRP56309.1 hypothetical protein TU77_08505 [Pseudomonas synxantha]SDU35559.1 hypothetical protein SAMN05216475_2628 [Pseudomonas synxantha]VTR00476.1 Uncharacterised protein [Pseudomonas synxantha]
MRTLWTRYLALLDNDLSTQIFDNVKNLLVCALLFAAGTNTLVGQRELFIGVFASNVAGWGLIILSTLLMLLNVSDGIRRLANLRYHLALQLLLILMYVVVAERVVEIVWGFRAH